MRVLVVHGSKRGGTDGLAQQVAATLIERGHDVEVCSGREVDGIGGYHAVIIGGALYAGRWQRHARSFVWRHQGDLRQRPVWMFSSGPLDHTASEGEIPPTRSVERLIRAVDARGHMTFGGRLAPDAKGWIAHAMVEGGHGGDFRDMDAVATWASGVADELATLPKLVTRPTTVVDRTARRLLLGACGLTGLTAVWGGIELLIWREGGGSEVVPPLSLLEGTPFTSFLVPGLLLLGVVGVLNLLAAVMVRRRRVGAELVAFVAGGAITVWIVVELLLIRELHWLHMVYFVLGVSTLAAAAWWGLRRRPVALVSTGTELVGSHQ